MCFCKTNCSLHQISVSVKAILILLLLVREGSCCIVQYNHFYSAGSVVANRLAKNKKYSVLLLEAGNTDDTLENRMPAAFPKLFKTERYVLYFLCCDKM